MTLFISAARDLPWLDADARFGKPVREISAHFSNGRDFHCAGSKPGAAQQLTQNASLIRRLLLDDEGALTGGGRVGWQ